MCSSLIFPILVLEHVCPVNMSVILAERFPLCIRIHFLDIRIFVNIIVPGNQSSRIVQGLHGIAAVDKIGIFPSCNNGTDGFRICLSGQPGFLYSDAGLLCYNFLHIVSVINFRIRHCRKHSESNNFIICILFVAKRPHACLCFFGFAVAGRARSCCCVAICVACFVTASGQYRCQHTSAQ